MLCFSCGRIGHKADDCHINCKQNVNAMNQDLSENSSKLNPVAVNKKRDGGGLLQGSAAAKAQKTDCVILASSTPAVGGKNDEEEKDYGPWILVTNRGSKPRAATAAGTAPLDSKSHRSVFNFAGQCYGSLDNSGTAAGNDIGKGAKGKHGNGRAHNSQEAKISSSLGGLLSSKGSEKHMADLQQPFEFSHTPVPMKFISGKGDSSSNSGRKGKNRISKAHFDKKLKHLGPVEPISRKSNTELADGEDASSMGA